MIWHEECGAKSKSHLKGTQGKQCNRETRNFQSERGRRETHKRNRIGGFCWCTSSFKRLSVMVSREGPGWAQKNKLKKRLLLEIRVYRIGDDCLLRKKHTMRWNTDGRQWQQLGVTRERRVGCGSCQELLKSWGSHLTSAEASGLTEQRSRPTHGSMFFVSAEKGCEFEPGR